jgi:hypothetical protein
VTRTKTALKLPGVSLRTKLITLLVVAALLWWIVSDPAGAANVITTVVKALVTFFGALGD